MPVPPWSRAAVVACIALALFGLAWALRAPLAPLRGLDSDLLSPVLGALAIRGGGGWFAGGDAIFGYGRDLSWVPLLGDGLVTMARRRALLQALLAPAMFLLVLCARGARPGALLGGVVAGVAVAWSDDSWRVVLGHHQSYLGVEWGLALVAGCVALVRGGARWRLAGAAVVGLALPMMVFSVPYAAAAAVVPLALLFADRRRPGDPGPPRPRWGPVGIAVLVAAAVAAPHALRLLSPELGGVEGEGGSLLGRFRQVGNRPDIGLVEALGVFLEVPLRGPRLLVGAAPILLLAVSWGDPSPEWRRWRGLAAGALLAVLPGALLVSLAQHGLPWHWLPLLPLSVFLLGLAVSRFVERAAGRPLELVIPLGVLLLLVWSGERERASLLDHPADLLLSTGHAGRIAALLPTPGPLVGYQAETSLARTGEASLVPAVIDAFAAGRLAAEEAPTSGPVTVYLEGPNAFIDAVVPAGWSPGDRLLAAGTHFAVVRAPDLSAALTLGAAACAAVTEGGAVRQIGVPELSLLPRDAPREPPAALHPCVLPALRDGEQKGDPVRQTAP